MILKESKLFHSQTKDGIVMFETFTKLNRTQKVASTCPQLISYFCVSWAILTKVAFKRSCYTVRTAKGMFLLMPNIFFFLNIKTT